MYELWGADNRTFAAEIAVPVADRPMKRLRETALWTAAAMVLPEGPEWITPERSQPISPAVEVMGQERNTLRRFVSDGRPLALGVHVIGDARCQTDSLFAWGCGNALMAAAALADAIADHPADADAQALALADSVDAELAGRYAYSVARNRASARSLRGEPRWDTTEAGIGLIDGVLGQPPTTTPRCTGRPIGGSFGSTRPPIWRRTRLSSHGHGRPLETPPSRHSTTRAYPRATNYWKRSPGRPRLVWARCRAATD